MNRREKQVEKRRLAAIQKAEQLIQRHHETVMLLAAALHQLKHGNVVDLVKLEYVVMEGDWRQR